MSALYEEKGELDKSLEQVLKVQETNQDNQDVANRIKYLQDLKAKGSQPAPAPAPQPTIPAPVEEKITGPEEQNPIQKTE